MLSSSKFAFIASSGAILLALYIAKCQQLWIKDTSKLVSELLHNNNTTISPDNDTNPWFRDKSIPNLEDLPLPVQRYFNTVFVNTTDQPIIRSLYMEQEGTFFLNEKWIPFTATQYFSASPINPGFVWDAVMKIMKMSVKVRDVYVDGKGLMEGKLLGALTVVNVRDTPKINEGELMRWLAESVLFPTALLPYPGDGVRWNKKESLPGVDAISKASAEMIDPSGTNVTIDFKFNQQNLISSIHAMRWYDDGGNFVKTAWEGRCFDYKIRGGMLVPTRMEAGWWKDGRLETYFKGNNTKLDYEFY